MLGLTILITLVTAVVLVRAVLLLFYAELGRKQDLIKHIYKSGTDFQIAVVVPFLDAQFIGPVQELIQALIKQDYPQAHLQIHLIATQDSAFGLPAPESWSQNVKLWIHPDKAVKQSTSVQWLVDRLLAAGGPSRLFVFLEPNDIVRADFLKNVTSRAFDCHAMQGYIALKRPPEGWVGAVSALSTRLVNRIENAGRFHMGLSCRLMKSGWVVRQELLEMIPYEQGADLDNLEYTIRLNLNNYRINWAPNVVVYRDERVDFMALIRETAQTTLNRIRLTLRYGIPLIMRSITKQDPSALENIWSTVRPASFVLGALLAVWAFTQLQQPAFKGAGTLAESLAGAFILLNLVSLAVARCHIKDLLISLVATPVVYAAGVTLFPIFLAWELVQGVVQLKPRPKNKRIGKRFDESVPSRPAPASKDAWPDMETTALTSETSYKAFQPETMPEEAIDFSAIYAKKLQEEEPTSALDAAPLFTANQPTVLTIPLSNGQKSVPCNVTIHHEFDEITGTESYHLVFAYKTLTFTTQRYPILDEAYQELLNRLEAKGFTLLSCGNCRQFAHTPYTPTQGQTSQFGLCLYRQSLAASADPLVTVLSEKCDHYTPKSSVEPGLISPMRA